MKIAQWISDHFWIFMISGLLLGLINPAYSPFFMQYLEAALIFVLLLVFLKIDLLQIIQSIRDIKLMLWFTFLSMIVVPLILFVCFYMWDAQVALGILLLTAMPAGTASPALADFLKGNVELSMSLAIFTSLLAPLTVPFLFYFLPVEQLALSPIHLFQKLGLLVFFPMILSQILKKVVPNFIEKSRDYYSAINVLIFLFFVYATIGTQRSLLLDNPWGVLGQTIVIYLVYGFLHLSGYYMAWGKSSRDKISIILANAYQNNGMAIVLAAAFFGPEVLLLVILSEFPWNTLPALYGSILQRKERKIVEHM